MPFQPFDITRAHKASWSEDAEDELDYRSVLDLNDYCIPHPTSTYFVRAQGDAMESLGIFAGDLLVVDRGAELADGRLVLAVASGEFSARQLLVRNGKVFLASAGSISESLEMTPDSNIMVWGVIIGSIHKF